MFVGVPFNISLTAAIAASSFCRICLELEEYIPRPKRYQPLLKFISISHFLFCFGSSFREFFKLIFELFPSDRRYFRQICESFKFKKFHHPTFFPLNLLSSIYSCIFDSFQIILVILLFAGKFLQLEIFFRPVS